MNGIYNILRKVKHFFAGLFSALKSIRTRSRYNRYPEQNVKDGKVFIIHEGLYGGASLLGTSIVNEWHRSGFDVDCIFLKFGPLVKKINNSISMQLCLTKKQFINDLNILLKKGYKSIYFNSVVSAKYLRFIKSNKIKSTICLVHELPNSIKLLGQEDNCRFFANSVDVVCFPSTFVQNEFENNISLIKGKKVVLHQGVYLKPSVELAREQLKQEFFAKYNLDCKKKIVINVASISSRKGFDIFVKASLLDADHYYVWVGDNPKSKFRNQIIKKLKPNNNLILVPYISDVDKLNRLLGASDCFFLTSREEPFGTVVLESFSNGVPVVAFQGCGGYVDVVQDNFTGYLVGMEDYKAIFDAFYKVANNFESLSKNCFKVADESDFEKYCNLLLSLSKNNF